MKALQMVASASLIALIFLCVAWEVWLAPMRVLGYFTKARCASGRIAGCRHGSPEWRRCCRWYFSSRRFITPN